MYRKRIGVKYSSLALSVLVTFFFFGAQANAASLTTIAVDSIGAIAAAEISCHADQITSGIKGIFGKGKSKASSAGETVPTNDEGVRQAAQDTADEQAAETKKITCTKAVEKAAAQTIIKELTMNTVNWINHGFTGRSPIYVQDSNTFLQQLQKKIVGNFALNISDPTKFPFGKMVMRDLIARTHSYFESANEYSLNNFLNQVRPGASDVDFRADFSIGGFEGLLSQGLPNNNPFGFSLGAQSELARRTYGTSLSQAEDFKFQIQRSGGFLDLKQCADPSSYQSNTSPKIADEAKKKLLNSKNLSSSEIAELQRTVDQNTCRVWKTTTPGSVVADQLNQALGSPLRQLEYGDDLQASLTVIFDALINQLVNKGLSALSEKQKDNTVYENNDNFSSNITISNNINGDGPDLNGSWLDQGEVFNIFTDIPKLMLYESNPKGEPCPNADTCADIDPSNWNAWNPSDDGFQQALKKEIIVAQKLLPQIYMLDLCVPGPRPNWEIDVQQNMQDFISNLPPNADAAISSGAKIFSTVTDPLGMFKEAGKDLTADKRNEKFYSKLVGFHLSFNADLPTDLSWDSPTPYGVNVDRNSKVNGITPVSNIFRTLTQRYMSAVGYMYSQYNLDFYGDLYSEISDNEKYYQLIPTYLKGIEENRTLILGSQATHTQLARLQERINNLPNQPGYPGLTGELGELPVISLIGSPFVVLNAEDTYRDPGARATDKNDGDITNKIQTTSNVDTTYPGQYQVTYTVKNKLGVAGNPVTRTVVVILPGQTAPTPPAPTKSTATVRDYNKDLLSIANVKNISALNPYEIELRRISETFKLIAPNIHSPSDITKEEDVIVATQSVYDTFAGRGGSVAMCVKDTNSSNYKGPTSRIQYPKFVITQMGPNAQDFVNFAQSNYDKKFTRSFLPDWHYAQGTGLILTGPSGTSGTGTFTGSTNSECTKESEKVGGGGFDPVHKYICNDDVVSIGSQPADQALSGLEQILGMY